MRCVQTLRNKATAAAAAAVVAQSTSNAARASLTDFLWDGGGGSVGGGNNKRGKLQRKGKEGEYVCRDCQIEQREKRSVPTPLPPRRAEVQFSDMETPDPSAVAPNENKSRRSRPAKIMTTKKRYDCATDVRWGPIRSPPERDEATINAALPPTKPEQRSFLASVMASIFSATFARPPTESWAPEDLEEDLNHNPHDFGAWRIILNYRRRIEGDDGVRIVWENMREKGVDLPVDGPDAEGLWTAFISVAARDSGYMEEFLRYAEDLVDRREGHRYWLEFYDRMMEIPTSADDFRRLHFRLLPRFRARDWAWFLTTTLRKHGDWQDMLKEVYASVPQPTGIYDTIISFFCSRNQYPSAMRWHNLLCLHRDPPQGKISYTPLLRWAATHSSPHHLKTLLQTLPISESDALQVVNSHINPHIALSTLFSTKEIPTRTFGDFFWASLLQPTSRIPIASAFRYILLYGAGCVVGPNTLSQASRILGHTPRETVTVLEDTGMVVTCLHASPRTSDISSCHCVASKFLPSTDSVTPFTCTAAESTDPTTAAVANINTHLHNALSNHDVRHSLQLMSHLRRTRSEIAPLNLSLLPAVLLRPRKLGKNPSTAKTKTHPFPVGEDVDLAVALHLRLVTEGYEVPSLVWKECIKRLGMARRWKELEGVLERLAEAFPPGPPDIEDMNTDKAGEGNNEEGYHRKWGRDALSSSSYSSPLSLEDTTIAPYTRKSTSHPSSCPARKSTRASTRHHKEIFTAQLIRSIIEWGIIADDPAWGICVVKDLKSRGIWVDARSVKRAVRVQTRGMKVQEAESVRMVVEELWGAKLWERDEMMDEIWEKGKPRNKGKGKMRKSSISKDKVTKK